MIFSEPVATITAAIILVGGGALAYWNQKRLDQNRHLLELRREAYQHFVDAMIATTSANARNLENKDELFADFQRASARMSIVASDSVLKDLADFQLDRTKSALSIEESADRLFLSLRKDVFAGSSVSKQTIRNAFPIKFGERR